MPVGSGDQRRDVYRALPRGDRHLTARLQDFDRNVEPRLSRGVGSDMGWAATGVGVSRRGQRTRLRGLVGAAWNRTAMRSSVAVWHFSPGRRDFILGFCKI